MSKPLPLTLKDVSNQITGRSGGNSRLDPSTPTRWILVGCLDRAGNRVKLKATRAGARWLVYQRDLDTFFAALAADPTGSTHAAPAEAAQLDTDTAAADRAGRLLQAAGA